MNLRLISVLAIMLPGIPSAHAACNWQDATLSFEGTSQEQAKCLLRKVKVGGNISDGPSQVPATLASSIGTRIAISVDALKQFAQTNGVSDEALGGALNRPLSSTAGSGGKHAVYFVIHDTSTPLCNASTFPENADAADAR